jgi:hypothetical protein
MTSQTSRRPKRKVEPMPDFDAPVRQRSNARTRLRTPPASEFTILTPEPPPPPAAAKPAAPPKKPAAPKPPPLPPPPVYRPRRRRGFGRGLGKAVLWIVGIYLALRILGSLVDGVNLPGSSTPSTGSTGSACPSTVARWLPNQGTDAVLVKAIQTAKHLITICRLPSGQYYYDGQVKNQPATKDNHITRPASSTATGFTAQNGTYTYEIRGNTVIVSQGGKVIEQLPWQPA